MSAPDSAYPPPPPNSGWSTPLPGGAEPPTPPKAWWKRWWAIALAAFAALLVIGGLAGGGTSDDDQDADPPSTEAAQPEPESTDSETQSGGTDPAPTTDVQSSEDTADDTADTTAPTTTAPTTTAAPTTTVPQDQVASAPPGVGGDRSDPVRVGRIADAGEGWRLQVLDVIDDATSLVLAENQFNDPPPPGTRFTIVTVALGYFGRQDPIAGYDLTISGVASASRELDTDCGVIPADLPFFDDLFAGGVVVGNLCFVTEPADAGQLQIYAVQGFTGDPVFLDASRPPNNARPMQPALGIQEGAAASEDRSSPVALGSAADVGEQWFMTVTGPSADITDQVMAENQFNDPPPEGYRFVGFPVELRYDGPGQGSGFDVTIKAVGASNLELGRDCGVIPNELDLFVDVFTGGTVTGTVCVVTPATDVESVVAYALAGFSGPNVYFATR